jgi:hypothetical protein
MNWMLRRTDLLGHWRGMDLFRPVSIDMTVGLFGPDGTIGRSRRDR